MRNIHDQATTGQKLPFLFRSTRIVTPERIFHGAVCVADGKIEAVLSEKEIASDTDKKADFIDCGDHFILPGFIDGHVHVNQPGRTNWEGMETASRAAAASGITMLSICRSTVRQSRFPKNRSIRKSIQSPVNVGATSAFMAA